MMLPTYHNLKASTRWWKPSVSICSGSLGPQGDPRFYKYYWRIFSLECPWEGDAFFENAPALCNADCDREVKRLLRKWRSCLIYGFKQPRMDPANPWDMTHSKWTGRTFSVSWDEDTDPVVDGGHK
jgi:hypothetical protein